MNSFNETDEADDEIETKILLEENGFIENEMTKNFWEKETSRKLLAYHSRDNEDLSLSDKLKSVKNYGEIYSEKTNPVRLTIMTHSNYDIITLGFGKFMITYENIQIRTKNIDTLKIVVKYCLSPILDNFSRIADFSSLGSLNYCEMRFFIRPSVDNKKNQIILIANKKYRSMVVGELPASGNSVKFYDKFTHGMLLKSSNDIEYNSFFVKLIESLPNKIKIQMRNEELQEKFLGKIKDNSEENNF